MTDSHEPELLPPDPDESGEESSVFKPFLEHLEDLRWMIIKMVVALALAMLLSFVFARQLMNVLVWPLQRVTNDPNPFLRTLEVTGGFTLAMTLSLYAGVVIACPLLLYFIAEFVLPALTREEKKLLMPAFTAGALLFLAGAALAYFVVIPAGLGFFIEYNKYLGIRSEWTIDNYISFVSHMVLAFGVCFELPLVVLILAKLGIVTHEFLRQKRPYVIVLIFIVAAVITPTTDMVNQSLLAVPMCLLYEACIWIAWWMERKKRRGSAAGG
jgi:sec-independent protein translocase protein TatC